MTNITICPCAVCVQVLSNRKCPTGKGHYSEAFKDQLRNPDYQERVRRNVESHTSNCGVPLHVNDLVVLDIDCVHIDAHGARSIDTMLLECVKEALPQKDHTYCVVSIKVAWLLRH